jgi:glutamyl-Q tRNA(Asp) synthetase
VRLRVAGDARIEWTDRRLGAQAQDLARDVGDYVLHRADGQWAYQLAVVVDDAEQGITDIVRGEDLADNTPRQILLQRMLGLPTPRYLHAPLVLGVDGAKLSKQNGAREVDLSLPIAALRNAGAVLGIACAARGVNAWLSEAVARWRNEWGTDSGMMPSFATPTEPSS